MTVVVSLTTDFEMSETHELLSWYLHGCNWVGVKIPQPGYLDPHPLIPSQICEKIFFIQTSGINSITRIT